MDRRPPWLLAVCMLGLACDGTIQEGPQVQGLTPTQQIALTDWEMVAEPAFHANTCDTCHDGSNAMYDGSIPTNPIAPPYLQGKTDVNRRDAAIAILPPVINLLSPMSSRVLVKQVHEGPALDAAGATAILTWIDAERNARPAPTLPETSPYTMMDCTTGSAGSPTCPINSIDLTSAGAAGTITFTEMPLSGSLYMDALTITAGASGLHVVHPDFGSVGAGSGSDPTVFDDQDRFFNVDMELDANMSLVLGTQTFDGFTNTDPLVVRFDTLTPEDH